MSVIVSVVNGAASLAVVALVGRAVARLLRNSEKSHAELVSVGERRATTAAGVPILLVGLSTIRGGALAVPFDALTLVVLGGVLVVYPDFTPTAAG